MEKGEIKVGQKVTYLTDYKKDYTGARTRISDLVKGWV